MQPLRQTVALSLGTVTLAAWGERVASAYLLDLLRLSLLLGELGGLSPDEVDELAVEPWLWPSFNRLLAASLVTSPPPGPLTWADTLACMDAMWRLNDIEDTEGKRKALHQRAKTRLLRMQGQ